MTLSLDVNTIVTALIVAALVGTAKVLLRTVSLQRDLAADFRAHEKIDDAVHHRVEILEQRVA